LAEENSDPHPLMGKPVQSPQGDLNSRFNIPFKHLKFKREIGMGGFGNVFVGEWQSTEVAIKVSNAITSFEEFQKEAELMMYATYSYICPILICFRI
jgi:predicted Ser/Thr protein kinase